MSTIFGNPVGIGSPNAEVPLITVSKVYKLHLAIFYQCGEAFIDTEIYSWLAAKRGDEHGCLDYIEKRNQIVKSLGGSGVITGDPSDMIYAAQFIDITKHGPKMTMGQLIRMDADQRGLLRKWDALLSVAVSDRKAVTDIITTMFGRDILLDDGENPVAKVLRESGKDPAIFFDMDDDDFDAIIKSFDPVCMYPSFLALMEDGVDIGTEIFSDDF